MDKRVLGFGSPLIDLMAPVSEEFLSTISGGKGGMEMVDAAWHRMVAERLDAPPRRIPGGSAGNTIFSLARLGVPTAMLGKLGRDAEGDFYIECLRALGGSDRCFIRDAAEPTGRCMSLVTPDSERTMRTHLGASVTLTAEEVDAIDFSGFHLVHIEGYMLFNLPALTATLRRARQAGCLVSLDLASYEVVNIFKEQLPELLETVHIVFANEDEARAFAGAEKDETEMLEALRAHCPIAVLKLGRRGAMIADDSGVTPVAAQVVENAIDTTGAGDLWQAGFLYGWLNGCDWATCGRFGARLGAEVVQVIGAKIADERWEAICADFRLER